MEKKSTSRRRFLQTVTSAAATIGLSSGFNIMKSNPANRKPNIIYIMADDLGYGDLSCYGQKVLKTRNIDMLADEGMRFTDCYAGSTVCAPSRCCLMTGMHTGHCRVRGNRGTGGIVPLRSYPQDVTIAELLKKEGYTTGIVGKWGIGEPETTGIPNKKGYDYWFGYLNQRHAHNYYPSVLWKNTELYFHKRKEYSHDLFTSEALEFVKRNKDNPFFLYLAYTIPHADNEGGRELNNGMPVPDNSKFADKTWPEEEKNFAAMVDRLDGDIGRLMLLLKELGIDENTVVFFTSDNGPHNEGNHDHTFFDSNGPLRGYKRDLYDGGIRVPMIVRWPRHVPAGVVSDQLWAFWDFMPTAAEIAGANIPKGLDGISILPNLVNREKINREYLYWEFHEGGFKQAIRMGDWKAVRVGNRKNPIEVYNVKNDIGEQNNIADKYPKIVKKAAEIFVKGRTESTEFPIKEKI